MFSDIRAKFVFWSETSAESVSTYSIIKDR